MIPNYLYAIKFNNSYKSSRPDVDMAYNFKKLPMKLICTLTNKCYIAEHYDNNTVDITAKVTHIVITHAYNRGLYNYHVIVERRQVIANYVCFPCF